MTDPQAHANGAKPAAPPQAQPGHESQMAPAPDYHPKYPGSGRLAGKIAFVSGGDSGIGRAVCVLFAREGADIALLHLQEDDDASETARLVEAEGRQARVMRGDVGDTRVCAQAIAETLAAFGRLDVLVLNAAEQHPTQDAADLDPEQIERTFRTNVFGAFHLVRAAAPHLQRGASVIVTTSVTAYRGSKDLVDYAATKGALVALTRSLASQWAERGVRVNAVAPGPIWTPLIPASFPPDRIERFGKDTPLQRPGQPNEVAPAFLFLACEDGAYVTGQVIHPNGGEPVGS